MLSEMTTVSRFDQGNETSSPHDVPHVRPDGCVFPQQKTDTLACRSLVSCPTAINLPHPLRQSSFHILEATYQNGYAFSFQPAFFILQENICLCYYRVSPLTCLQPHTVINYRQYYQNCCRTKF